MKYKYIKLKVTSDEITCEGSSLLLEKLRSAKPEDELKILNILGSDGYSFRYMIVKSDAKEIILQKKSRW